MSQPQVPPRDENAVAEIPPDEGFPGSVQGGGSDILLDGADSGSGPGDGADENDVGTLADLEPEVIQEDKGATGD